MRTSSECCFSLDRLVEPLSSDQLLLGKENAIVIETLIFLVFDSLLFFQYYLTVSVTSVIAICT